jgi:hypothetical protein
MQRLPFFYYRSSPSHQHTTSLYYRSPHPSHGGVNTNATAPIFLLPFLSVTPTHHFPLQPFPAPVARRINTGISGAHFYYRFSPTIRRPLIFTTVPHHNLSQTKRHFPLLPFPRTRRATGKHTHQRPPIFTTVPLPRFAQSKTPPLSLRHRSREGSSLFIYHRFSHDR